MNDSSATLITTADRSVKAITAATAGLAKVVADLTTLNAVSESLSADIQQKEGQLSDLTRQLDLDTRRAKAELDVRVAEAEREVLDKLLDKNGLSRIKSTDLSNLLLDLEAARRDVAEKIAAAVQAAESSLHGSYQAKLNRQDSDFKVATAELTAELRAIKECNLFLTQELERVRGDLVAEREARIKIAQTDASRQGVVVNAGKQ